MRWATFLHDVGKPVTFKHKERIRFDHHAQEGAKIAHNILRRLAFSKKDIDHITWVIEHHMMLPQLLEMPLGRQRHWFLLPGFKDLLAVFEADIAGTDPASYERYTQVLELYNETIKAMPEAPTPFLSGNEVMELLKIKPGKKVGEITSALREKQLGHELNTKQQATEWLLKSFSKN